jgi:hypothetical protein
MRARDYARAIVPAFGASLSMIAAVALTRPALPDSWQGIRGLGLMVAVGGAVYIAQLLIFHRKRLQRTLELARALRS